MTNKPLRSCIVCRNKGTKDNFIKLVKTKDGIMVEKNKKLEGRGAYVCKNQVCTQNGKLTKAISRTFKIEAPEKLFEDIADELKV